MCLTLFKCLLARSELNLANKLTKNAMSNLVHCAKYIIASIAFRHDILRPNIYSSSFLGRNRSCLGSRYRTIIEVLSG